MTDTASAVRSVASFNISTGGNSLDRARFAAANAAAVLDEVWIVEYTDVHDLGSGVYLLFFSFQAPRHEVTSDAPILRRAAAATGWPTDAVQARPRHTPLRDQKI